MKNLNYITYDAWWDTDITVLDSLKSRFNLTVHVINGAGEKNMIANFVKILGLLSIINISKHGICKEYENHVLYFFQYTINVKQMIMSFIFLEVIYYLSFYFYSFSLLVESLFLPITT